jgi:hypothetical protein
MCCHRLARPERAHFFRCVVAHRKNKAEMGCFGCRELIPGLAASVCGTQPRLFDLTDGFRPDRSGRITPRACKLPTSSRSGRSTI